MLGASKVMGHGNVKGFIERVWQWKELKIKYSYDSSGEGPMLDETKPSIGLAGG